MESIEDEFNKHINEEKRDFDLSPRREKDKLQVWKMLKRKTKARKLLYQNRQSNPNMSDSEDLEDTATKEDTK